MQTSLAALNHPKVQSPDAKPDLLQKANQNGDKEFSVEKAEENSGSEASSERDEELMEAANEVEGFIIGYMLKQMRETINRTKGLYERGRAEKMFRGRLDRKMAQQMAQSKDFGIAETVYNQFSADKVK